MKNYLLLFVMGFLLAFTGYARTTDFSVNTFTINAQGDEVIFAPGNLQYQASTSTWRFAEHQYDYAGDANAHMSATCTDWVDLFGWGANGYHNGNDANNTQYQPWSVSTAVVNSANNYYGYGPSVNTFSPHLTGYSTFYDWGRSCVIADDPHSGEWFTLTGGEDGEWYYLFNERQTATGMRYATATVNGVCGVVLFPDGWSSSQYTFEEYNSFDAPYSSNIISEESWMVLETRSCVFLPAGGYRNGTKVDSVGTTGFYWASKAFDKQYATALWFNGHSVYPGTGFGFRCYGGAVRLVRQASESSGALTVETGTVNVISADLVSCSAKIISNGGSPVTMSGVCWSEDDEPTLLDNYTQDGTTTGEYVSCIGGLQGGNIYYVRAYAVNRFGVAYGETQCFTTVIPEGAIRGMFTVDESGTRVFFSQGNLQYIGSAETPYWQFAENQWVYLGNNGQDSDAQNVDRDLFGWGTSGWDNGNTYYHPYDTDESAGNQYGPLGNSDLTGTYANADWGVYNAILNGGNASGQWRTLTADEWSYLFFTRSTTSGKRFAHAQLNGVNGVILLPDDWNSSCYTLNPGTSYTSNVVDASTWQSVLEANGAVFLPLAGYRSGTSVVDNVGYYWSSTSSLTSSSPNAKNWQIQNSTIYAGNVSRVKGNSVRLVRPVTQTLTVGELTLSDIADHSVDYSVTITDEEGLDVKACGLCWSTKPNPDLRSDTIVVPVGNGTLTGTLKGLISGTKYYVRAYATNNKTGLTVYGEVKEITTTGIQGTLAGKFAVSATDTVCFSQGNLQYIGSAATPYWKFADRQWDYLGNHGQGSDAQNVDRDLFGWGTSGYDHGANQYQPWATSQAASDYYAYGSDAKDLYDESGKADWGYNAISNGGNQENQWRTLTKDEWYYLLMTRETTSTIRYALAQVCGVNGLILLPDDWESSIYTLNYTNNSEVAYTSNVVNSTTWQRAFEANGAVFLPAAGDRNGSSVIIVGSYGYYWSSSYCNSSSAYYLDFNGSYLDTYYRSRYYGQSVRLVRSL